MSSSSINPMQRSNPRHKIPLGSSSPGPLMDDTSKSPTFLTRDIEMAWPDINPNRSQMDNLVQNCNLTQNSAFSRCVIEESHPQNRPRSLKDYCINKPCHNFQFLKYKVPDVWKTYYYNSFSFRKPSCFNLMSPSAPTSMIFPNRNIRKFNPYRKPPGKRRHVYFKEMLDIETRRSDSLPANTTDNKKKTNADESVCVSRTLQYFVNRGQKAILNDNAVIGANSPVDLGKITFPSFRFRPVKQTDLQNESLKLHPRCEFTIIEIEPGV